MKIVLATVFFVLPFCNLASGSELYWTGFGGNDDITSANLDGTNIQTLVPGLGYPDEPFALAIDSNTQKMYWTDASGGRIQTANLDGSDRQTILTGGELRGIAIDSATQQLFFTDVHGSVESVNLDGTDRQTLITGLASPINIVLDVPDGKMYFSQTDSNQIDEANLDGSDMHAIISTGLNRPEGLALDLGDGKIYFTNSGDGQIERANLDGSDVQTITTTTPDDMWGIAVDPTNQTVYWTDDIGSRIETVSFDGSDHTTLLSDLGYLGGIAVVPSPEPATWVMLVIGAAALLGCGRRAQRS